MSRNSGTHDSVDAGGGDGRDAERALVRGCCTGDRAAQEEFYRRYRGQVAATLFRVLHRRDELEDLVQEVFVIAFRGLAKFRGDARISTWMHRICVNVALGAVRKRARRPPPLLAAEPVVERVDDSPETPHRELQRTRAKERVYRLLTKLSPKKRIVLYLHEIEGRELNEIAEIVGAHPVTVRTRLFYARKEFYRRVAEEDAR